ncbi:MAG TPA: hypothetical protein VM053_03735 [Gemmatimonadaceae bacterium]|nr:hypothetical protein [Gemmatimonadaceae bacterium]
MIAGLLAVLLQVVAPATATPPVAPRPLPDFPVQLGVRLSPDTVTVGQRFIAYIKIRAPVGATIDFPTESDSAAKATATATQIIGKPAVQTSQDSTGVTGSAAYRLAAWDVNSQTLGLGDIIVRLNGKTGYVSLASTRVFVKSVLPADTGKWIPRPARPAMEIRPFDWLPWFIALAALVVAGILWRVWVWYRNRKSAPVDPYTAAQREFGRIEALGLVAAGEGGRHAALMSDVMRDYLSARAPGVERSQTSSELLASADWIHGVAKGLGELLWRTDLIKFAAVRVAADEGEKLGLSAKAVVESIEAHLVEKEKEEKAEKAEKVADDREAA